MDYIANDVNYAVTETVFQAFNYDPRFKPSFTQKRHSEAVFYERITRRGFYNYAEGSTKPSPNKNEDLGKQFFNRILAMLMNEAFGAVLMQVVSEEDVELAITKSENYLKGLISWSKDCTCPSRRIIYFLWGGPL